VHKFFARKTTFCFVNSFVQTDKKDNKNAIKKQVRIRVKLTNAADLALVRRNMMPQSEVRSIESNALVDTGAVTHPTSR